MPIDRPEFTALLNHYPEVLDEMPEKFTSHQFILTLAQRYQHQYINLLRTYQYSANPFNEAYSTLAKGLNRFPEDITKGDYISSTDIFGNSSKAYEWHKVTE